MHMPFDLWQIGHCRASAGRGALAGKCKQGRKPHTPGSAPVGALRSQRLSATQRSASPVLPALPALGRGSQQKPAYILTRE